MSDPSSEIVHFWFGVPGDDALEYAQRWFRRDRVLGEAIRTRFGTILEAAIRGELDGWAEHSPTSALALIVLLDQFPRNVWRNTERAYAQDVHARSVCVGAMDLAFDRDSSFTERAVFYLPLMHAEDVKMQQRSVQCYRKLLADVEQAEMPVPMYKMLRQFLSYALRNAEIIELFGRFPQRNEALGRRSTLEEAAFLRQTNSIF
jgi:uncharacterized protein (DUF924 family)